MIELDEIQSCSNLFIVHLSQWLEGFKKLLTMNGSSILILNRVLLWSSKNRMTEEGGRLKEKKNDVKRVLFEPAVSP